MSDANEPVSAPEARPLPPFVPSVVREQVERDLGALGPDEHFALIAGIDPVGARLAIVARGKALGGNWSFSGYTDHQWGGATTVGAKIVFAV